MYVKNMIQLRRDFVSSWRMAYMHLDMMLFVDTTRICMGLYIENTYHIYPYP